LFCRYQQHGVPISIDNKKTKITKTTAERSPLQIARQVRLVRGRLDGVPRPRSGSDSYEAPSTGAPRPRPVPHSEVSRPRPDPREAHPPTRKNSDSREPGSRRSIPSLIYPGTKVRAFNAITYSHLPAWSQPGSTWEQCRCQSLLFNRPSLDGS
jgi:hypothetical protein